MKKMSYCSVCGFKTKEVNRNCPLCLSPTNAVPWEDFSYEINLPPQIKQKNNIIYFGYYCTKCRTRSINRVCITCNNLNPLTIMYQGKRALIHQIENLEDVFTKQEVLEILNSLTNQEKYYIYHHLSHSDRFFYRRDSLKAGVSIFIGILMYSLSFIITANDANNETLFLAYFSNAFGMGFLLLFTIFALWYLCKPTEIEQTKLPTETAIIIASSMVLYIITAIFQNFDFNQTLLVGFLFMGFSIILYSFYIIFWRKKR